MDDSVSTVILYSDGCCYQNRNVTLSNALIHFAMSRRKTICQKCLEKGHTWMEVDSVHSAIEGKLRGRQIFWPAEYIDVITDARRDHPYEVKQVEHTFFRDFSKLNYLSSIRPDSSAGDPQIVDLRCLQYLPDGSVSYKINYTDQWRPLPHADGERTKLMTTRSPRCTRHPCVSRAPNETSSAAEESIAQRLPSLL